MTPPKWLERLLCTVCESCINDVNGRMCGFTYRWAKPDDNHLGVWLLQIAPCVIEISGGKDDGARVFDFMDVDLLTLPKSFDEVESFKYDPDYGKEAHMTLVGKTGKRKNVVEIYFEPFAGDEPDTVFDANDHCWRDRRMDAE